MYINSLFADDEDMNEERPLRGSSLVGPRIESTLPPTSTRISGGTTSNAKRVFVPSREDLLRSDGGCHPLLNRLYCEEMMPTEDELRGTISGVDHISLNPEVFSLEPLTSGWNTLLPQTTIDSEEEWTEEMSDTDSHYEYEWQF